MTAKNTNLTNAETRYLKIEVRASTQGKTPVISGMAAIYNQEAIIGDMFREVIKPGAFKRVLSENPDVIAAPNHDWNTVLGRTIAGTLQLEDRPGGLHYDILINPQDSEAMNFYERVRRGDVRHSSFAFTAEKESWTQPAGAGQLPLRAVLEVKTLYDVSPVTFPAYPTTTSSVRSFAAKIQRNPRIASDGARVRAAVRRRWLTIESKKF